MRITHVAMSVPVGGLSEDRRVAIIDFYGRIFGWREMVSLRLPDRLTISVGPSDYINIRERADPMECSGYEHFGLAVTSAERVHSLWNELARREDGIQVDPIETFQDGSCSFRFRHLLPLAIEIQFIGGLST